MKAVTRYQANDGTDFDNEDAAKERDGLIAEVAEIMKALPARPKAVENGAAYLQHEKSDVLYVQAALARIVGRFTKSHHIDWVYTADRPAGQTFIGRIIDDYDRVAPVRGGWFRIMCIDDQYREWQQPYYTRNTPADIPAVGKGEGP